MTDSQETSIQLKRQVTIKTRVTDTFRGKASKELGDELKLIDSQLNQLETQYQQSLQQLEQLAKQGQNVQRQLEHLNREAQEKRNQLGSLRIQVSSQLGNLDKLPNGSFIVTGMLENYVSVGVGDNIYDKIKTAEIIVEDGLVQAIHG